MASNIPLVLSFDGKHFKHCVKIKNVLDETRSLIVIIYVFFSGINHVLQRRVIAY